MKAWKIIYTLSGVPMMVPMDEQEEPAPDWQKRKIDAACDYRECQLMGIRYE